MLGFLKKFKKSKNGEDSPSTDAGTDDAADQSSDAPKKDKGKKKRKLPIKMIIIILLVLVCIGASGFVVYTLYFSSAAKEKQAATYKKIELKHVALPQEILEFSFYRLPDLYAALITYNNEIILLNQEIERIDAIGTQYPDQKKIADKEKKTWEKTKAGLEKSFLKILKPVKEIYVLFRVNNDQGLVQINEKSPELAKAANDALKPVQEMTGNLKSTETIPDGFIKGTFYKLKKKFL